MNDYGNLSVTPGDLRKVGGEVLPGVAETYSRANQNVALSADKQGKLNPLIQQNWIHLRDTLQTALGQNVNNLYDVGVAVIQAANDYEKTDENAAKTLAEFGHEQRPDAHLPAKAPQPWGDGRSASGKPVP